MTEEQQKWLAMREQERQSKHKEYLNELALKESEKDQKQQAKNAKGKDKKKDNAKEKPKKDPKKPAPAQTQDPAPLPPPPPVLENPEEIMQKKFPVFDADEYPDAQGSLRFEAPLHWIKIF